MRSLRRSLRILRLALHLGLGAMLAALLLPAEKSRRSRARRRDIVGWWNRALCRILGVQVIQAGEPAPQPVLFVCNHISWLDIPVLSSALPTRFLAKQDIRRWPLVGWLAARAGTLFLRRGERGAAGEATLEMVWTLRGGESLVLFPEGTTTDGSAVAPFRSRLFEAAILAGTAIQPVALRFTDPSGRPHPWVPFIGEDAFLPHLLRLTEIPAIQARVTLLEAIPVKQQSRNELASRSREAIAGTLVEDPLQVPAAVAVAPA